MPLRLFIRERRIIYQAAEGAPWQHVANIGSALNLDGTPRKILLNLDDTPVKSKGGLPYVFLDTRRFDYVLSAVEAAIRHKRLKPPTTTEGT